MSVKTPADIVNAFAKDLIKPPAPSAAELQEQAKQASPAMASFVDMATSDLQHGGAKAVSHDEAMKPAVDAKQVLVNENELRNAFAASAGGTAAVPKEAAAPEAIREKTEAIIDEFKRDAEEESTEVLDRLLKGLR